MFNDAQTMLKNLVNDKRLKCCGALSFYKANSDGDDILVYDKEDKQLCILHGLRQQVHYSCVF